MPNLYRKPHNVTLTLILTALILTSCGHPRENHVMDSTTYYFQVYDPIAAQQYNTTIVYQQNYTNYNIYYVNIPQYNYNIPIIQYNTGEQFTPYDWQDQYQWPCDPNQIRWIDDQGQEALVTNGVPRKRKYQ